MSKKTHNAGFTCELCGCTVLPLTNGSYRNHCPSCLHSKHVDIIPGDRKERCGGLMRPIGLRFKSGKGLQIIHQCIRCGAICANRIAENTEQPDIIEELVKFF
jgi:hypothetical protein